MTYKNDSISGVDTASKLAVSSEFLSIVNIITLPDEAVTAIKSFSMFYFMRQHLLLILLNLQVMISDQKFQI